MYYFKFKFEDYEYTIEANSEKLPTQILLSTTNIGDYLTVSGKLKYCGVPFIIGYDFLKGYSIRISGTVVSRKTFCDDNIGDLRVSFVEIDSLTILSDDGDVKLKEKEAKSDK